MNCPFHISVYKQGYYSYRDLPIRWAELGTGGKGGGLGGWGLGGWGRCRGLELALGIALGTIVQPPGLLQSASPLSKPGCACPY